MKIRNSPFLQMFYSIKNVKLSELFSEDISFTEYGMLQLITEMANETGRMDVWVADIVKRVEVTPQAVSKFINLAVGKGYLERFENESDRMTDLGRAVLIDILLTAKAWGFWGQTGIACKAGLTSPNPREDAPSL